jgi:hypothetical protein
MSWTSKIVGHSKESPSTLVGNPLNFREHPEFQRQVVADSIEEIGFIRSITVNKRTGYVVDGHERLWQALAIEENNPKFEIDVEWVDLTEHEERLALSVLDQSCTLAKVNGDILEELLHEINTGSQAIAEMLTDMRDKAGNSLEEEKPQEEGEKIYVTDNTTWQLMVGNLPQMNVQGDLIQMVLPAKTINKIAALIIKQHAGITDGQEST